MGQRLMLVGHLKSHRGSHGTNGAVGTMGAAGWVDGWGLRACGLGPVSAAATVQERLYRGAGADRGSEVCCRGVQADAGATGQCAGVAVCAEAGGAAGGPRSGVQVVV